MGALNLRMKERYNVMSKIQLIHGDCLEEMNKLVEQGVKVDAIITDPPYKISNSGGGLMNNKGRAFIRQIDSMDMCKGSFDVFEFLNLYLFLFKQKEYFCGVFFCSMSQIKDYLLFADKHKLKTGLGVWYKPDPTPLCNNKYLNDLEYWIYIKGNKTKIRGEYKTKSLLYKSKTNRIEKKKYKHPTIKPLPLIEKFVINHSIENQTIIDPYMGTGTTGVACKKLNRNFIGIEKENKVFKKAKSRIKYSKFIKSLF
jgi:DNA modification methylase